MPKYVVRHGVMRQLGVFSARARDRYARGQRVIARTGRGQEVGEVLCEATDHVQSQMDKPATGQILRLSSPDDDVELRRIEQAARNQLDFCRRQVAELGLAMEMVDAEQVYGGERSVFYYLAEERIDFRQLVKLLAKEFQTRIEMRQIGVRDEAKLLADYGDCGKPVCCNTHLSGMPPVSMKMAKLQKATLDPTKISGRCGRLKCCLRYEYDTYRDMQKELPRVGAEIITSGGRGKVLAQEVLAGQVLMQTEDMRRIVVDSSDVLSVLPRGQAAGPATAKTGKPAQPDKPDQPAKRKAPPSPGGPRPAKREDAKRQRGPSPRPHAKATQADTATGGGKKAPGPPTASKPPASDPPASDPTAANAPTANNDPAAANDQAAANDNDHPATDSDSSANGAKPSGGATS
ncbi:MAG: regulatory iron-sulfur-containing complex subunit RicT [Planctomycetota bacterium]